MEINLCKLKGGYFIYKGWISEEKRSSILSSVWSMFIKNNF